MWRSRESSGIHEHVCLGRHRKGVLMFSRKSLLVSLACFTLVVLLSAALVEAQAYTWTVTIARGGVRGTSPAASRVIVTLGGTDSTLANPAVTSNPAGCGTPTIWIRDGDTVVTTWPDRCVDKGDTLTFTVECDNEEGAKTIERVMWKAPAVQSEQTAGTPRPKPKAPVTIAP